MNCKLNFLYALALVAACFATYVLADNVNVEDKTASPLADMALIGIDDIKTSTEKPPAAMKMEDKSDMKKEEKTEMNETPVRTVGDFIIHPLVAFRPRPAAAAAAVANPEDQSPAGKQADTTTSTPAPWPVFGLGYGQAIGSSVANLAGQFTGWLNDRIQLPGLVDTPVRDSTTSTSTSTTPRPDVIVRVQHRPAISINDNRNKVRPNQINVADYEQDEADFEEDEEEELEEGEDYGNNAVDEDEDEEEEDEIARPNNNRRPVRKQQRRPQQNRKQQQQQQNNRRPINNRRRQQYNRFDDYAEDDSDDSVYSYAPQFSSKRSQQSNFVQLGQQSLLNQIRLLTRGQTPAEVGEVMRKNNPERQQGTFLVRRNGQTVYLAPELLNEEEDTPTYQLIAPNSLKEQGHQFPQPPLTKPLKINGQIQQYITIPYNQLGIVPPEGASAVAEGVQSQPLILSIPQSALKQLQSKQKTNTQLITPNAVPLLTEAALADIFKPPQIPPSRTMTHATAQNANPVAASYTPVLVYTQNGSNKIRPSTIVEQSPSFNIKHVQSEEAYFIVNDDNEEEARQAVKPASGDARVYKLPKGGRFAVRNGRTLDQSESGSPPKEESIPVQIVQDSAVTPQAEKLDIIVAVPETAPSVEIPKEAEIAQPQA